MVKIIRRLLGDTIAIDTTLDPGLWTVRADPGQLEQVFLNLALNARDAMPHGGRLRITTHNLTAIADSAVPAGRHIVIDVSDTGVGMNDETRARVFEPFFTTKDPNGRPGLGLATVYGIVLQSGGQIAVESAQGKGARFTIHLPVAAEGFGALTPDVATPLRSSNGNTILIVEDNEGVRALTVRLLADAGYKVFEGCDGVDALDTLRSLPEPVDLLISDVMMPRMNGSELATHFHRLQPGTPVLLMSGYMDEDTVRRSFSEPDAVLAKPFTADALFSRVRDLIGAPKRS